MTMAKLNQVFLEEIALSILESSELFPIDFDDAIAWWDCRTKSGKPFLRYQLVRKLEANYYEDTDYKVVKFDKVVNQTQGDNTTADKYFLTIECFQMMEMQVSGERGDQIRRYFLECKAQFKLKHEEEQKRKHEHEEEQKRKHESDQKRRQWAAIKGCDLSEPKNWERQFPPEFWQELERVTGRPQNINARLVTYFYNRFPQGVHKQNTLQNPRNENGNRRAKTDQVLTQNFGVTALDLFKAQFIAIINVSPSGNYALFKKNLEKVFATEVQLELPMLGELEEERAT